MHVQTKQLGRILLTVLFAVGLSTAAVAGDVVDVRIGTHPTYTRVVFELDAASGYSVERRLAEDGVAQLLVTMDVGSAPRGMDSRSVMVERVAIQEGADRAVAHIRLKHKPSRLKELILTNPPRLVFDFVYPEAIIASRKAAAEKRAAAAAAKTAAPRPTQVAAKSAPMPGAAPKTEPAPLPRKNKAAAERVAAKPAAKPAPTVVAKPTRAPAAKPTPVVKTPQAPAARPTPVTAVEPAPTRVAKAPVVETPPAKTPVAKTPVVETPTAKPPVAKTPVVETPTAEALAKSAPSADPAAAKALVPDAAAQVADEAKPEVVAPPFGVAQPADEEADVTESIRKAASRDAAAKASERAASAKPKPSSSLPAVPAAPAKESGLDWALVGGVAAGALALFVAFFMWSRRRALPNDFDVTALGESADGDDDGTSEEFAMGASPTGFSMGAEEPQSSDSIFEQNESAAATPQAEPVIAAGHGLFDDESDKESDAMDLENPDLPMDRTLGEMPTQTGIGVDVSSAGGADVTALLRDFESRLVKLETQLDEANDARERLERQVTAQAEELRVQRAAIARTQRALRGMNGGEGDQATEPAIREQP